MITKEQWSGIESTLKESYSRIKFDYRGIEVSIERRSTGEGKTELAVFIQGVLHWGAGFKDSENYDPLTWIFWRPRKKQKYPTKFKKDMTKILGKRGVKKSYPDLDGMNVHYSPLFTTSKSLVTQYKKIDGLELSKKDTQRLLNV